MHESLSRTRLERRLGPWAGPAPHPVGHGAAPPAEDPYDRRRELKRDPAQREARRQERADARRQLRADYQGYRARFVTRRVSGEESRALYRAITDAARARRREVASTVGDPRQRKAFYSVIAFETLTARENLKAQLAKRRAQLRQIRTIGLSPIGNGSRRKRQGGRPPPSASCAAGPTLIPAARLKDAGSSLASLTLLLTMSRPTATVFRNGSWPSTAMDVSATETGWAAKASLTTARPFYWTPPRPATPRSFWPPYFLPKRNIRVGSF